MEREFLLHTFCSIAIAGGIPLILSHSGFRILPINCLAYEDKLSTYLRWPSAYRVSKAKDDLPEPLTPETTINLSSGMFTERFLRLFTLAPFISMLLLIQFANLRIFFGIREKSDVFFFKYDNNTSLMGVSVA